MHLISILVPILVALTSPAFAKEPIRTLQQCTVTKISDGDTITATCSDTKVKARLYGIDAPEAPRISRRTGLVHKEGQPFGAEAHRALTGKLQGQRVDLAVMEIDRYRRLVSVVFLERRNINFEMVREGWGWAYRQYLHRPYASAYLGAEEDARQAKRGLWKQANPEPPWNFRRAQRERPQKKS